MASLFDDFPGLLLQDREGPCLSLYMPTHRQHPDNLQDPIRFRNSVKALEKSLKENRSDQEIDELLVPFHALAADTAFWNRTLDGLAVLAARGLFRTYRLQRAVPERTVIADSFHIKPLLRIIQSADRYRVLGLSRGKASLFEGNRDVLDEVDLPTGMPHTPDDAPEGEDRRERATRHYGKAVSGKMTQHGTDLKQDAIDNEAETFFRAIDRAILEGAGQSEPVPLLLAALPENHHRFRRISRNPSLAAAALYANPESISSDEMRQRAWDLVKPYYLERLHGLTDAYNAARAHQAASGDLSDIGAALAAGRVQTLLVDADRVVRGRFEPDTGTVTFDEANESQVDDLLDDLAEATLRAGGEVVVVPSSAMPTETGAAAVYRF